MDPRSNKPRGTILSIHTAAAASAPMASHQAAQAVKGKGLEGDRYSEGIGTYSNKPGVDRELTLIESEVLEALEREQGIALRPEESRRNLVTRGIALNPLVGLVFRVGEVKLKAIRLCEPCGYLQNLTGKPVFEPLKGRGGLRAQILEGGTIRVGDAVEALADAQAEPVATPSRR
jgi:MOSC domain-containing protein YiiM